MRRNKIISQPFNYDQFTEKVSQFHVYFDIPHWFPYKKSIKISCTEGQYIKLFDDHEKEINELETTYGILEVDGTQLPDKS